MKKIDEKKISRKEFFKLAATLASMGALGGIGIVLLREFSDNSADFSKLSEVRKHFNQPALEYVAEEYFYIKPRERSVKFLDKLLLQEYNDSMSLAEFLHTQIKDDFNKGRIFYIDHWMLSVTECRLYAALSILFKQQ